jgi:hypothetical protein
MDLAVRCAAGRSENLVLREGLILMTDPGHNLPSPAGRRPIPITQEELLADWEGNIDRVIAGDTFLIIVNGNPACYLMPISEYERLKILETKAEEYAWLKAQEPSADKAWGNEADAIYDEPPASTQRANTDISHDGE